MYYCQCKLKSNRQGRLRNEASWVLQWGYCMVLINLLCGLCMRAHRHVGVRQHNKWHLSSNLDFCFQFISVGPCLPPRWSLRHQGTHHRRRNRGGRGGKRPPHFSVKRLWISLNIYIYITSWVLQPPHFLHASSTPAHVPDPCMAEMALYPKDSDRTIID